MRDKGGEWSGVQVRREDKGGEWSGVQMRREG